MENKLKSQPFHNFHPNFINPTTWKKQMTCLFILFLTQHTPPTLKWRNNFSLEQIKLSLSFNSFFPNKKSALNGMLIWLATIWEIWLDRNNVIFRDKLFIIEEVFEACRRRSWKWFKCYAKGGALGLTYSCLCNCPFNCIISG